MNRTEQIKGYLKRLGDGESLENVKKDFVKEFNDVNPIEIMEAEQALIAEGTPISEVSKLCDVHAALFHGATKEERIAKAENEISEMKKYYDDTMKGMTKSAIADMRKDRESIFNKLAMISGHPLNTFVKENKAIQQVIDDIKENITSGHIDIKALKEKIYKLRELSIHYAKKGDLLYPVLNVRYKISGPSAVMWTVDDEIRDEISALLKDKQYDKKWYERLLAVVQRAEEMIYKEANILFPNCAANFTEEEWIGIYHDQKDYADCLGVKAEIWEDAESNKKISEASFSDSEIIMPGGHLTVEQLTALLNTIPLEITFVDVHNINRFFNEGSKDFKRPAMAIDREVFSCHPPKVETKVRRIIEEFRAGTLDEVPIWMEKNGKCMLVRYIAVRDTQNNYLGTLELVQDMDFAKEHFSSKKKE